MLKKIISFLLAILLLQNGVITVWADERPEKAAKRIAKAKAEVAKLGTGDKAGVKVKLASGVEWKGRVVESKEDQFTIDDPKTGQTTAIRYQDVAKVKKWNLGRGMSKTKKGVIIGAAVAGVVSTIMAIIHFRKFDIKFPPCFPNCPPKP